VGTQEALAAPPGLTTEPAELDPRRWWVLAIAGIAQLIVVLDVCIVNIALPRMQTDLGFSDADRQWIVTAYALTFGSLLLLGGRLSDLLGVKRMYVLGAVGFGVASGTAGAANGFYLLVAARAAQGIFAALLAPASLAAVSASFTRPVERARAFGVFGAISGVGGGVGLILGGVLTETASWRATMYVNVALAAVALLGCALVMRGGVSGPRPVLDLPGTAMISAGLFSLVLGLVNSETHGWRATGTWVPLVVSVVLLVAFAKWQTRARHPLLPPRILNDRIRAASLVGLLIGSAGTFSVFLFLTYYFQLTLRYSPVRAGLAFLPMIVTIIAGSVLSMNRLLPKIGPRVVVPLGMLLCGGAMVWLTGLGGHTGYANGILAPLAVLGIGFGLIFAPGISLATSGVRGSDTGVASAAVNTTQQVGGSVGIALLSTLSGAAVDGYLRRHQPVNDMVRLNASLSGTHASFWWAAGLFALGAVTTAFLYRPGIHLAEGNVSTGNVSTVAQ
jgi:EmrB/QacA subfamily drug resistance transporter